MRQDSTMIPRCFVALTLASSIFAAAQAPAARTDEWLTKPVDDRTFKTFLDLFTYDRKLPLDLRALGNDEQEGIRREHLSFQSTPGIRVFAHLYQPPGAAPDKRAAVIMLHGGTAAGKDNLAPPARNLARAGFSVLAIDMQYFGERSTDLLTTFTEQEKHDRLYNQQAVYLAWVAQTVKDVGRAFDLLVEHRRIDPARIGIVGNSRGAIAAAIAAATDRRLAAVVMFYGGHFDALERGHPAAACPANFIGRISPRPLLMLNGTLDADMIRETSVEPLFKLARQPKQMLWSDGGHMAVSEQNLALMLQWIRERLK
jgi:dienelactone hydrolase